jgi:raffinose/stachyose/melibiose transport system substrate-binding protein
MKRLSLFLSILLAVAVLSTFVGCKKKQDSSGGGSTGSEKITLELMHFQTLETIENSTESKGYHLMKDKYIKEHPDVKINETIFQQVDYHTKIMALAAADEMPDIYFTKGSWVGNFYNNKLMADLTSYVDQKIYRPGLCGPFSRDGKLYALPIQLGLTCVVYYNEKMYKDIGFDHFPETWDELVRADKAFSAKGITTIALGNRDKWPYESCVLSTLGDRFTGPAWTDNIILNNGKAKFTDPEFITALEYSQQMAAMFNKDFNAINNEQSDMLFATGKASCTIEGQWEVAFLLQNSDPDVLPNIKIARLPSFPGQKGDPTAASGGAGWAQSVSSKLTGAKLQAAVDYNNQTTGVEYSQFSMDDTGLPAQCEVPMNNKSKYPQLSVDFYDFINAQTFVPIYDIQMDGAVIDVMNSRLQDLLAGRATPREVAAAIQAEQAKL